MREEVTWIPGRTAFQEAAGSVQGPAMEACLDSSGTVRKLAQLELSRVGAEADYVGSHVL